jgi:hypothetical protein
MSISRFAEKLARSMLAGEGTAVIWRLHVDAAMLYRTGNRAAAVVFVEIADAAERELRRCAIKAAQA